MTHRFDYLVIGGGISGLTAAHILSKRSDSVALIEPGELGGSIRSRRLEGFTMELGATTLVRTPQMEALLQELDLLEAVTPPAFDPFTQYVWHRGRPRKIPRSPAGLLFSGFFSFREKIALARGLIRCAPDGTRLTVAELFGALFSPAIVRKALAPVLRGIYGGDSATLLASSVFPKLTAHLERGGTLLQYLRGQPRRRIFHLQGGNQRLPEKLAQSLSNTTLIRDAVADLRRTADGIYTARTPGSGEISARKVLIATSGASSAAFLENLAPRTSALLRRLRYAPITVVHVAVPRSAPLLARAFGVLFPAGESPRIIGVLFNSQLFPDTAPPAEHLLTVCLGGVDSAGEERMTNAELSTLTRSELSRYLRLDQSRILSIHRWVDAIPQYERIMEDLEEAIAEAERTNPGLRFIGVDRGGVGVPERIRIAAEGARSAIAGP